MKVTSPSLLAFGSLLATAVLWTGAAPAADVTLEEVTVTAQKREQKLEDVGIAVTALSGAQVKDLQIHTLSGIVSQTPSLSVSSPLGEGGNQNFTLRGVGLNDFSEHNESPVATYQDGVYQGTLAGVNGALFDVERVEVLRGPQGTLYGRNSTGGLVQFVSKGPTPDYQGYVDAGYGSYSQKRLEGAFGGPMGGPFQFRIAGLYDKYDGYGRSTMPGVANSYGLNQSAARAQVKWTVNDDAAVLLNLHAASNHATGPAYVSRATTFAADGWTNIYLPATATNQFCPPVGVIGPGTDCFGYKRNQSDPWTFDNDRQSFQKLDTHGASITVNANIGGANFTSISGYESVHKLYGEDTDGGPFPALAVTNPLESRQYTQEFRLNGSTDKLVWTGGLYYSPRKINTGSDTNQAGIGFIDNEFKDELVTKSAAAFGQLEYSITPTVTLIGGLRYSRDDQHFQILTVDHSGLTPLFLGITPNPVPNYNVFPFTGGQTADLTPYRDSRKDNLVTYRAELDWKFAPDSLLYGSVSKGNKSAGWNVAIDGSGLIGFSTTQNLPYKPENLLAYEVGVKRLVRGLYRMRAAAFYYDYKDFQAFNFVGYTQQISNLPATVKGAELEFSVTPSRYLELTGGASYLSTQVRGVVVLPIGGLPPISLDRQMVLAPKWTLNAIARFHANVTEDKEIGLILDTRYTGRQYFDLQNDPIATQNGQAMSNASLYFSDEKSKLRLSIWVKNLANKAAREYTIPVTGLGFQQEVFAPPRWFGATLSYSW